MLEQATICLEQLSKDAQDTGNGVPRPEGPKH